MNNTRNKPSVRLKRSTERTHHIEKGKQFWYNRETIVRIKTILNLKSDLYLPQELKETPKEKESKTIIFPFSTASGSKKVKNRTLVPLKPIACPPLVKKVGFA